MIFKNKDLYKKFKIFWNHYSIAAFFTLLLILTSLNIYSFLKPKNNFVLGAQTKNEYGIFWFNFLKQNPTYIPGWIEIGRPDKVKAIDPNYF